MPGPGIRRNWRQIRVSRPSAGADWAQAAGGQRYWRITTMVARLVTSAVAGNRRVRLQATEGGLTYFVAEAHLDHPANTTVDYAAHTGSPATSGTNLVLPLPLPSGGLVLRPGASLAVVTSGIDAGDQWSAITALAEEIPSGLEYEGDQFTRPTETLGG